MRPTRRCTRQYHLDVVPGLAYIRQIHVMMRPLEIRDLHRHLIYVWMVKLLDTGSLQPLWHRLNVHNKMGLLMRGQIN